MPETISFWWAAGGYLVTLVVNAFGFGWLASTIKKDYQAIKDDASEAVQLARAIRDADLLGIRKNITDMELDLGLQGAALTQMRSEHEQIKRVVLEDLPTVVEGAIKRAAEQASNAAWTRRRR